MTEHQVAIDWERETDRFTYDAYNRDHLWTFAGGVKVSASAAPDYMGNASYVNPEEALVAALSSCHMLTFLAVAARKQFVIDVYHDDATGILEKNADGKLAITRVTLRPKIAFSGEKRPTSEELKVLHDQAHRGCFIANSVKTEVKVEIR
ncbi:MAG TPA: OsmC family protein [Candidatus Manganitrophaceae bacterium]|nr:OsmC family protein [Candidatus Manganitrophaceae bacterium]